MSQAGNGGRRSPNYKNNILLEIIKGIEPAGRVEWERVARYKEDSQEAVLRETNKESAREQSEKRKLGRKRQNR
jgi:hypothetical protein